MRKESSPSPEGRRRAPWKKLIVLALVVAAVITGYLFFGDALTLESFAEKETALKEYQAQNPAIVFGVAFAVYVVVTGLSLPGAAPLTLLYGWYFDFLGSAASRQLRIDLRSNHRLSAQPLLDA